MNDDTRLKLIYALFLSISLWGWFLEMNKGFWNTFFRLILALLPLVLYKIIMLWEEMKEIEDNWNKYHGTDIL